MRAGDRVPGRARSAVRWLAVAVLAGFLGMHGVSTDHDTHLLAAAAGGHHAAEHGAAPTAGAPSTPAAVDALDALGAVLPAWDLAGRPLSAHDDGCLLALTISVLTVILALLAARRARASRALLLPRAGDLLPSRGPPRRAGPSPFALGVLRT